MRVIGVVISSYLRFRYVIVSSNLSFRLMRDFLFLYLVRFNSLIQLVLLRLKIYILIWDWVLLNWSTMLFPLFDEPTNQVLSVKDYRLNKVDAHSE